MVNTFSLRPELRSKKTRLGIDLSKRIRDRCVECWVPRCWELKDPLDDGQISLSKDYIQGSKRIRVQIRRLLFLIEYEYLPIGKTIGTQCKNPKCVNPAHARVKGFEPSYRVVMDQVDRGWLSPEDADRWYRDG